MFDNKWQKKEMPLVSLIGMGGGIASPAFLAAIILNILKPTILSPEDDTGVPDFDYTAESSAITNINQIAGGWSTASFDSNGNTNQWQSVAYGNGKYVALGAIGNAYLAANSTDGINWTSYSTIPYTSYSELAYGNGAFVAVGTGKIVYSTDEGASWSSASVASNWWKGVTYGDGKFVAVSEDGTNRVATSSDGINWTETSAPGNYMWLAVTYGGGKYVAVSQQGDAMYSSDGTNWSTTSVPETGVWNSVAYGNGKFVAVAGTKVIYSTDGINWSSGNNTIGYWKDITFGDGRFVAVSNYQDSSYPAAAGHSTDGDTWTPSNQATSGVWYGVDYVNSRFIAVAGTTTPKIMWSTTGADEATELTLTDTTVSRVSNGTLIEGESIDQVLTVGETVQADTTISTTVTDPVFSTTSYSYTGYPRTITNGIDLAGEGGLIWTKWRSGGAYSVESHCLIDTERSSGSASDPYGTFTPYLKSDAMNGETNANYFNFNSDGYEIATGSSLVNHSSGGEYVSWTFRKAPGFFDIVKYAGNNTGSSNQTISHNLGEVPGMIIIKELNSSTWWPVFHKDLLSLQVLMLNRPDGVMNHGGYYPSNPTATTFEVGNHVYINETGDEYIAYLFADNPDNQIKCGSYVGNGTGGMLHTLGFKPHWLMIKKATDSGDWAIVDSTRGNFNELYPNRNYAESGTSQGTGKILIDFNPNGFYVDSDIANNGGVWDAAGETYIYVAIGNGEVDITTQSTASGTVSASSGDAITLSNTTGTWSTGMKVQGVTTDTKDYPDPIRVEDVSLTSSAPSAENPVSTWGNAVWEIATDENFTQNVQTATTALSATGTQTGPSFSLETDTGYYTRTKYTALGQESEWSDVTYFKTQLPWEGWHMTTASNGSQWRDVVYANGMYVACAFTGSGERIMYSYNGIDWNDANNTVEDSTFTTITYGEPGGVSTFVTVAYDTHNGSRQIMYSNDGINWTAVHSPSNEWWRSVTYGNGRFVCVGSTGSQRVMYSNDGINWSLASTPENNTWISVVYADGKFVAVSADGTNRVMYSTNGISWSSASTPEQNGWISITYGNGKFVAVAYSGTNRVMYSTDGINWTQTAQAAEQNEWRSITYGEPAGTPTYLAVSGDGTNRVMYSTDAINWYSAMAAENQYWTDVTWGGDKFIAVYPGGGVNTVMWSFSGVS